ncbi:MAG: hypothetical protein J7K14_07825 [Sulfurimonas sp.]|nr:hypothetical protein [Sulfurimonas sp.]
MKINSFTLVVIFLAINLYADKNWIQIEPINKTQTAKSKTKLDVNLSQIEPINKMMKNATVIKQLIDATNKKEKPTSNEKNWFVLKSEDSK